MVERPADGGTPQDPAHKFAGERDPTRVSRCIGGRSRTICFGRFVRPLRAELITETPEPRGKSSLVGWAPFSIVTVTRVISHVAATYAPLTTLLAPLKAARTI